jgi:succinoglycan biosynthesis transport protein ExoP
MTLLDFIHILSRRKWVIILTAFFTLLVFALAVFNTPPKYTATSSVRILTTRSGSADYVEYNVDYSTRVMNTYKELATSAPVLEELGQYVSPIPKLEVNIVPDSELIEISATDIDPGLAQFAANKLGDLIVEQSKLMSSSNEPPVTAYVAEPAVLPDKPSSPSPYMLIGLGLVVGLIGGLALAFVFESLDTRLYTAKQIEAVTNLSTIGDIPDFNGKNSKQQLYIFERQVGAESIRRLSANILSVMREKDIKSFLVTSPVPRDGRSAIVANLAISLAQTKRKVLVIDADMRNPKMHEIFGMTNTDGLTRLLTLKQDASKTINSTGFEGVDLLSSGPRPANPIEILDTSEIQKLIHYLE